MYVQLDLGLNLDQSRILLFGEELNYECMYTFMYLSSKKKNIEKHSGISLLCLQMVRSYVIVRRFCLVPVNSIFIIVRGQICGQEFPMW